MSFYNRPALKIEEQINYFKNHGLKVISEENFKKILSRISFFRFREYLAPLIQKSDNVNENDVVSLYIFDHRLRIILFEAIKIVEVALRTQIVQNYATKYGPFGYSDHENFNNKFKHNMWIEKAQKDINNKKNNHQAIKDFYDKYENQYLPLWIFAEYATFGSLSLMMKGMHTADRKNISKYFGIQHQIFINWIHVLVYIRNICAHHSRLWNLKLKIPPVHLEKNIGKIEKIYINNNKIFSVINIILYILLKIESPITNRYKENIFEAMNGICFFNINDLQKTMGFIENWKKSIIWKEQL